MAQKVFKGFMQVTEGSFEAQTGYIYFVRNSANTGHTDGYIQFNGKKYGTAAEAAADLNADVEALESALGTLSGRVDAIETGYTTNATFDAYTAATDTALGAVSGRVDVLEASAATKEELGTLSGRVDTIENDYLQAADKTELEGTIGTLSGRVDDLEAIDADNRLDALESVSADTRLDALEEDTHTHDNKSVLDAIDQNKVDAWDSMAGGANVVLSAYTDSTNPAATAGMLKTYEIFQGGVSKGKIDIPKDLVVTSGVVTANTNDEKVLRLTIANQAEPVDILVSDLAHVYSQGNGIEISASDEISAKVVNANGLSVDANGIAMALADGSNAGAMSAADFTKLGTIETSAQTNVIEEIKVDGTALTVDNKSVNIQLPDYSGTYAPLSLTGTVETNRTDFDNYTAATASADTRLTALETSASTWNGVAGSADTRISALEAVSADTRLDALEELSGASHTHANQSVLDGISSEDVAAWDAAEQNAKDYADGLKNGLNADVSGESNGVTVQVVQASGVVTDVNVTAPDFDATYAPISLNSAATRLDTLEAVSADTRLDALEAISADTRLDALEELTGDTASALQSISAGDASVSVGTKDSNNDQSVAVHVSSTANNALSVDSNGLFAAIYYDGDDSN